ncbi:Carboxypeptidase G2 precursor [Stieleria bergensis]|uniref:Carboxypeptidase G2 n=1 Tax=Stieleria bergensis TaxID=2528025 RepID=A0A517SVN9_9BACT|nr:Carboxypeptidase G2 precursor [Planctomycetes bacterium SV_7m_r]
MPQTEVDTTEALQRYLQLTAIPGGSGDEKAVADEIVRLLVSAGVDPSAIRFDKAHEKTRIKGNCGNLIVDLPGTTNGPRTLLSAHMDTVPICIGCVPEVSGARVNSQSGVGLGADDRSGCAVVLTAAIERINFAKANPDQTLHPATLLFTIQEEVGLEGARHLDPSVVGNIDQAFNFDGGSLDKVTTGAVGGERIEIELCGTPAHAGVAPQEGCSAIVMAGKAIATLEAEGWLGLVDKSQTLGQNAVGTANVGVIKGGEATNVITPAVTLRAEARSHNADFRTQIVAKMKAAFESAAASTCTADGTSGSCEFSSHVDYEAFRLADDDSSVSALETALASIGRESFREVANGGLDANWLNLHGIPAVTVGCGQMNIHTADEQLDIDVYHDACRVATLLITSTAS